MNFWQYSEGNRRQSKYRDTKLRKTYLEPEKSAYGRSLLHSQWMRQCLSFCSLSFIFLFVMFSLYSLMKMEFLNILFTFLFLFLTKTKILKSKLIAAYLAIPCPQEQFQKKPLISGSFTWQWAVIQDAVGSS